MHQLAAPVAHVDGNRAVLEVSAQIQFRDDIEGVRVDLVSFTRLLYQLERIGDDWKIKVLRAIYERDTITPVVPGTSIPLDSERLAQIREQPAGLVI
ncbi:hypothetical protein A5753_23170 [Mycobacterium sp. 852002-51971_SCH5477799-a]|uniref:hypothetical protein n=1 Tax=Mycobacterium sp. 852002-51971_SCH5477799-a TaxID=1834106 RepID=UPI0007FDC39F|nr:hypothetical protein A5753_23170 [Mycobacterium sp. 852002-51971_SCH5477799-a]